MQSDKHVLIFGATGNIGGAATRELLMRGWHVRAVTRDPNSDKALAVAKLGAELFQADMEDRKSVEAAFDGYKRVFSVQSWGISGVDGEVRQGKLVAEAARSAKVEHLVYGSAGTGEPDTGVPHFQSKIEVESYMQAIGLPFTIIRPGPFMELLTKKEFFPALGFWGTGPKVLGWDTPIPWVAVRDIGVAVANCFDDPHTWIGRDVSLFGDVKSLSDCRDVFAATDGKGPFGVPLPVWLFRRMAGDEFIIMWQWLVTWVEKIGVEALWRDVEFSRQMCPGMLDLERWLQLHRNGQTVTRERAQAETSPA